ncbi:tRNA (adenosine(37)-N6)-dimethylallyltransferase MiaA [Chloroflexota bacterium]
MNHLVAIVGPTGIGKSQLAIRVAQTFNGEIISADSRQIYRYMDIGTATPSREELSLVPHHLINILKPDEDFGLAQYQELAYRAIDDIHQRKKLPILVGGSGQYVWTVLEGWGIPRVPPDMEFRRSMEEKVAKVGKDKLYQELEEIDPIAAQRIDQRNVRRVIRALEVHRGTETSLSHPQYKKAPPFNTLIIGLTADRAELYSRIDLRVDKMIDQGLVAEVEKLVNMGYDFNLPAMSSIGYKQIGMFLNGELTLATAIQQIKFETHRFVRQQYNWFQLKDDRIKWFAIQGEAGSDISLLLTKFMQSA